VNRQRGGTRAKDSQPSGLRLAIRNGSYQGLTNIYYILVRGAYVIFFARILGVELYGHYVYSQNWYILAMTVAAWGMNELAIAEWARTPPDRRSALAGTGMSIRLVLGATFSLLVALLALALESDDSLRILIIIYSQGVLVRGATNWLNTLFIGAERSHYCLYLSVPFLTLEVAVAVALALSGHGLVSIAISQCLIWWLTLLVTWLFYRGRVDRLRLHFDRRYAGFFLGGGPPLALASFILAWFGPGLLILYRLLGEGAGRLGEAAMVIQILVILDQTIRMAGNGALPQLSKQVDTMHARQSFYARTIWEQSLYMGGAGFLLGYCLLPGIIAWGIGESFAGAADLFARFCWILIPLVVIHGMRLVLISHSMMRTYLLAIMAGLALLLAQLSALALYADVSLHLLLSALGIAYCAIASILLFAVQRRLHLFGAVGFAVPPVILIVCLLAFFQTLQFSIPMAMVVGVLPLAIMSVLNLRTWRTA